MLRNFLEGGESEGNAVKRETEREREQGKIPPRPLSTQITVRLAGTAMAFTFAAFCYMLTLVLCAALIFFVIWQVRFELSVVLHPTM